MAVAFVSQWDNPHSQAGSASSQLTGVNAQVGDTLVLFAHLYADRNENVAGTTVTDSAGNTWVQRGTVMTGVVGVKLRIFAFSTVVTNALVAGTVKVNTPVVYWSSTNLSRWTGVGAFIGAGTQDAAVVDPGAVVSVPEAPALVIGAISYNHWTDPTGRPAGWTGLADAELMGSIQCLRAYRTVDTTGSHGPKWTLSTAYRSNSLAIAFAPAASAAPEVVATATVEAPSLAAAATATSEIAGSSSLMLPHFVAAASLSVETGISGVLVVPRVVALSAVEIAAQAVAGITIPRLRALGSAGSVTNGHGSVGVPRFRAAGVASVIATGAADIALPLLRVLADAGNPEPDFDFTPALVHGRWIAQPSEAARVWVVTLRVGRNE